MSALGRVGGKRSPGQGKAHMGKTASPERESLREALRDGLDHELVLAAVKQSLAGGNESARVAAVKFLADLELYRKDGDECPRCAAIAAEGSDVTEKLYEMLSRLVEHAVRAESIGEEETGANSSQASRLVRAAVRRGLVGHEEGLEAAVEAAWRRIIDAVAGGWVPGDVGPEQAARTLEVLEERGLLVGGSKVAERAEEIAQERLAALRQEHGIPA